MPHPRIALLVMGGRDAGPVPCHEGDFQKLSRSIDALPGMRTSGDPAVGRWAPEVQDPGAEPSTVATYRNAPDFDAIRHAMACKGDAGNQLAAVAMHFHPEGKDQLWSMMLAGEMSGIAEALSRAGVQYRTMALGNGGKSHVMIFDRGGEMGVKPAVRTGSGEMFPPEAKDRRAARKAYRRITWTYERKYPDRPHWP